HVRQLVVHLLHKRRQAIGARRRHQREHRRGHGGAVALPPRPAGLSTEGLELFTRAAAAVAHPPPGKPPAERRVETIGEHEAGASQLVHRLGERSDDSVEAFREKARDDADTVRSCAPGWPSGAGGPASSARGSKTSSQRGPAAERRRQTAARSTARRSRTLALSSVART